MKNRERVTVFYPGKDDQGRRIDRVVRKFLPRASLSGLYRALRLGRITVNGKKVKQGYRLGSQDEIAVNESLLHYTAAREKRSGEGADISAIILYEDEDLLVLNKPRGVQSHGPSSLDLQVKSYLEGKLEASLSFKPGPLHRLDRNTSGIIMFSKSLKAAQKLSALFADKGHGQETVLEGMTHKDTQQTPEESSSSEGALKKYYLALVDGDLEKAEYWESLVLRDKKERKTKVDKGGKKAKTAVLPLISGEGQSLCLFRIDSGRSHQIRVQTEEHGHPLSGDRKYNGSSLQGGYLLHACCIKIEKLFIYAHPPANFIRKIETLFGKENIQSLLKSLPRILREEDFSSTLKEEEPWE